MRETVKRIILGAICFVVGFMLGGMRRPTKTSDIMYKTDTIECVRLDTCKIIVPEYKYIRTVDTILINSDDGHSVSLPITQKHYAKDSVYDVWVSGYEPRLDSISIFERTKIQNVTNTIVRKEYYSKWGTYITMGYVKCVGNPCAEIGVTIKSPKHLLFGISAGLSNNDKIYYNFKIGYKIN